MMENTENKIKSVILSGAQPTGGLTIGSLFGALQNWVKLQDEYECYFMIADLHSITLKQEPAELRKRTLETAAFYLACGIDPEKSTLFVQSKVVEHTQLTWVLNCFTGMGECSRMTQFKDKSGKNPDNINVGLFSYPVLMAADILLYQADLVPVGEDQKQHLELSRNLAQRFNFHYSETFKIPEPYIPKIGARIMSLQEPTAKMSKSDPNENATIFLSDDRNTIIRKVKRAVTDSGNTIEFSDEKPGIKNLLSIYSITKGISIDEAVSSFQGAGYGDFKLAVAEALADYLAPITEKYHNHLSNKKELLEIMVAGAEKASRAARKTVRKVYKKIGFLEH